MFKTSPGIAFVCVLLGLLLIPTVVLANGLISNGDFEVGESQTDWFEVSLPDQYADHPIIQYENGFYFIGGGSGQTQITAHSGEWAAWFSLPGDYASAEDPFTSSISQTISMPPGSTYALVFYHWIDSEEAEEGSDVGRVLLGETVLYEKSFLSNIDSTYGWVKVNIPLPASIAEPPTLKFELIQDDILLTSWFVDDVSLIDITHQVFIPLTAK